MLEGVSKRINVCLSDYPYQRDIAHRLNLAELSVFEVDVIQEILHSSLNIPSLQLADSLSIDLPSLLPILEKLEKTGLFCLEKQALVVDKHTRKLYTSLILKFDDSFRADMEFLRQLLYQIPIHLLPVWYSLPRTSDDIFSSIVQKFFLTPKIYQEHLDALSFDDPRLHHIIHDVYAAPDFKVRAKVLKEKYALSRETFEEYMLLLEFHFACCLSYNQYNGYWEEVVTPFFEWRIYQRFLRNTYPTPIQHASSIQRTHFHDFGFLQDVNTLLTALHNQPLTQQDICRLFSSSFPNYTVDSLTEKLLQCQLATQIDNVFYPSKKALDWLQKHPQEQGLEMYRMTAVSGGSFNKDQKEIEKCLKPVAASGWVYFEDFVNSCTASIGTHLPVTLQKTGKRWKYSVPNYTERDMEIFKKHVFQNLFHAGIVATGVHDKKPCFCVTPFGRMTLT